MVIKHEESFIYIFDGNNEVGHIEYVSLDNNIIDVIHTVVSENYQGQGIAGKLFNELIRYVKDKNLKIIPTCSYISHQVDKHDEIAEFIAKK